MNINVENNVSVNINVNPDKILIKIPMSKLMKMKKLM